MFELDLPDLVRQRASRNGAAGTRWLAALPHVVAELAQRWGLELGETFTGGTAGYVLAATDTSGRACVVKIAMPLDMNDRETFARSVRAHELAAGRGCAELYAHDASVPAMLLERLGPNLAELGLGIPAILEAITATLREYNEPLVRGDTPRLVRERAVLLAERCSVDAQAVWEWGFIERVSTGLANVRDLDNADGATFLEVARRCL